MNKERPLSFVIIQILWFALLLGQFAYGGVLYYLNTIGLNINLPMTQNLLPVFLSVGIVSCFLSYLIPKIILRFQIDRLKFKYPSQDLSTVNIDELTRSYYPIFVVRMGLIESVVVIGFTLSMSLAKMDYYFYSLAVGVLGFALNFPTLDNIKVSFKS